MPEFPRESGPVGFLSQSGGNAGDMVYSAVRRGIRFSKVISYGNAADLNECDFLEYLAEDPETAIIAAYIEGVRGGPRFFRAMRRASERKPVVVLKGGRTEGGNRAAFSHTGSLAGSADVFSTLVKQVGAVRVDSVEELVDVTVAFRFLEPPPAGRGAAVVGVGGGYSVFAADEVNEAGLELPRLSESVQEELRDFTPVAGTSVRNPIDTLAMMNPRELTDTVRIVAGDPRVDIILFHIALGWGPWRRMQGPVATTFDPATMVRAIADAVARARDASGKPVAAAVRIPLDIESMEHTLAFQERCWQNGLPVFLGIPRAANAIAKVIAWREMHETLSD
jgi:acyl-CoA synthetase (NDP forming)